MFVYIARHAWAGHFGDAGWGDDSLRELTPEGAERYMHLIEALAEREFAPERIVTSPYVRCRQTAEIIAKYAPGEPTLEELEALAPGVNLDTLLTWTNGQGRRDVCWCGHNPDVEALASILIGGGNIRFAKGAIAAIRFHGEVEPGGGVLYWHLTAKSLGV
jgi:phosphohistidine phosphatase